MTPEDVAYVRKLLRLGLVESPCLELGAGAVWGDLSELLRSSNVRNYTTDVVAAKGVDYVVDFEDTIAVTHAFVDAPAFRTVLVMNVLEHTFDPARVLDNVFDVLAPGGRAVLVTPVLWPLHRTPLDFQRLNPDWYEEYARRRGVRLVREVFEYVAGGSCYQGFTEAEGFMLPRPTQSGAREIYSRVVHRAFGTTGRGMRFPSYAAIGAVLEKPA